MAEDPYKYFRLEAHDLVGQLSAGLLALEKAGQGSAPITGQVQGLLRLAHTLKGAARVVKLPDIADHAHRIEDLLAPGRGPGGIIARDVIAELLRTVDVLAAAVANLDGPSDVSPEPTTVSQPVNEHFRLVRADVAEMDALLDGIVEAHTVLNGLRAAPTQVADLQQQIANLLALWARPSGGAAVESGRTALARASDSVDDLRKRLAVLETRLTTGLDHMDRELRQLREAAEQLRLVSARQLFGTLERLARDLADRLSKQVVFSATGAEIHLDAYVLSTVQDALVQIVRNAVVHGIETESERVAAGKRAAGHVTLTVRRHEGQVIFRCEDDGRGIDFETVRKRAVAAGKISPDASPSVAALTDLLLRGGLSTMEKVTGDAGRGVGLDVVRAALAQLGGKVDMRTVRGASTTFEIVVPVSVASIQGLMAEAGGDAVVIPLDAVRACLRTTATDVTTSPTGASILHDAKVVPFAPLSQVLFDASESAARAWSTIVVADGAQVAALGVDRLLGTTRTVVRPLSAQVPASALVAGAALDAEGNPLLVLDPSGLVGEVPRTVLKSAAARRRATILVIDDSLTTRMLEQSILESAGYDVDLAASGEDGLEKARSKAYGLILVDVEMPGMDGFTFVEHVRADAGLRDMPVILVTSRNSAEDLARGAQVGANGYMVKGEFNQSALLAMIAPLVGDHG